MARKLRLFKEQMTKAGISPTAMPVTRNHIQLDDLEVCLFLMILNLVQFHFLSFSIIAHMLYDRIFCYAICIWQIRLGELEAELIEVNANNGKLQRTYNELLEYMLVLRKVSVYFHLTTDTHLNFIHMLHLPFYVYMSCLMGFTFFS